MSYFLGLKCVNSAGFKPEVLKEVLIFVSC